MSPRSIVAADFNLDGRLDLATADGGANTVSVLIARGNGVFGAARKFTVMQQPQSLAAGDFNGDGRPDVVVTGGNQVMTLPNDGAGGFGPAAGWAVSAGAAAGGGAPN